MKYIYVLEDCLISNDPSKYYYIAQGMLTIDGVDDVEEMKLTDEAFDILGFAQVWMEENDGIDLFFFIEYFLGRKDKFIQMYCIYYAFW
jgi:hypothetical protein